MADHKSHPSGRPIRKEETKGRPLWRIPDDGYVIPRLREKSPASAIGFTVGQLPGDQQLDDD